MATATQDIEEASRNEIVVAGSNVPQTAISTALTVSELSALPARLDDGMLAKVDATAKSALPALPASERSHFGKCIRALSILPSREGDAVREEVMYALYHRQIGHYPNEALSYLTERATAECKWFPTIAECLGILQRWQRCDDAFLARHRAQNISRSEREARLRDARLAILDGGMTAEAVSALPRRIQQILDADNLIRLGAEGEITILAFSDEEREFKRARFA